MGLLGLSILDARRPETLGTSPPARTLGASPVDTTGPVSIACSTNEHSSS